MTIGPKSKPSISIDRHPSKTNIECYIVKILNLFIILINQLLTFYQSVHIIYLSYNKVYNPGNQKWNKWAGCHNRMINGLYVIIFFTFQSTHKKLTKWKLGRILGSKRGLLTWPKKDDQKQPCKMTKNAEDGKRYFFNFKIDRKWQL